MTGAYPLEDNVSHIYSYTPATNQWQRESAIPVNRRRGSAGAVVYNNKIYIIGGNTRGHSGGMVSWFDEYNPQTGQWRVLPSASIARDHMQVAIANGKLVVAAGRQTSYPQTFSNTIAQVDIFNFSTSQWSSGANIPTRRAGTMAVSVGDEVVIIGGETQGFNQARNQVEAYNVNTGNWRSLRPLNQGRHSGGAAVLGNKIHVVTGNTSIGGGNETISHETLQINQ